MKPSEGDRVIAGALTVPIPKGTVGVKVYLSTGGVPFLTVLFPRPQVIW